MWPVRGAAHARGLRVSLRARGSARSDHLVGAHRDLGARAGRGGSSGGAIAEARAALCAPDVRHRPGARSTSVRADRSARERACVRWVDDHRVRDAAGGLGGWHRAGRVAVPGRSLPRVGEHVHHAAARVVVVWVRNPGEVRRLPGRRSVLLPVVNEDRQLPLGSRTHQGRQGRTADLRPSRQPTSTERVAAVSAN